MPSCRAYVIRLLRVERAKPLIKVQLLACALIAVQRLRPTDAAALFAEINARSRIRSGLGGANNVGGDLGKRARRGRRGVAGADLRACLHRSAGHNKRPASVSRFGVTVIVGAGVNVNIDLSERVSAYVRELSPMKMSENERQETHRGI
jgi:hypothetical protein